MAPAKLPRTLIRRVSNHRQARRKVSLPYQGSDPTVRSDVEAPPFVPNPYPRVTTSSLRRRHGDSPEADLETLGDPAGGAVRGGEAPASGSSGPSEVWSHHPRRCRVLPLFLLPRIRQVPDRARPAPIHRYQRRYELRRLRLGRPDDPRGGTLRVATQSLRVRHQQEGHTAGHHQSVGFFLL